MSRRRTFRKSFAEEFGKSLARGIVLTSSAIVTLLVDAALRHLG